MDRNKFQLKLFSLFDAFMGASSPDGDCHPPGGAVIFL